MDTEHRFVYSPDSHFPNIHFRAFSHDYCGIHDDKGKRINKDEKEIQVYFVFKTYSAYNHE